MTRESSPMPSPIPTPPRTPTGSHAAIESESARALRVALEARELARGVATDLGRDPDPAKEDDEGAGLRGRLFVVEAFVGSPGNPVRGKLATGAHAVLATLSLSIDKLTTELTADRQARAEAAARLSKLAWGVGLPVLVAIALYVGSVVWRWLSTLHH